MSESPPGGCAAASRNNNYGVPGNGSQFAQFTPKQPQRTKSHGGDHCRCLFRGELDVLGALFKLCKNLLRLAAAQRPGGFFYKQGKNCLTPRIIDSIFCEFISFETFNMAEWEVHLCPV